MHDYLTERVRADHSTVSLVMPLGRSHPAFAGLPREAFLVAFAERGITWCPERLVIGLDSDRKVAMLADGAEMPFDLFLGVPVHKVPVVVEDSGLTVDGWVPVNPLTLETRFPGCLRRRRCDQCGNAEGRCLFRGTSLDRRPTDHLAGAWGGSADLNVRRTGDVLPRVRPRSGCSGKCHLLERPGPSR